MKPQIYTTQQVAPTYEQELAELDKRFPHKREENRFLLGWKRIKEALGARPQSITTELDAPRHAMPGGCAPASAEVAEKRLHKRAKALGRTITRFSSRYIADERVEVKGHLA